MKASEVPRAVAAAMSTASTLDMRVADAVVLRDSNRLAVRLLPCDVLARVAHVAHQAGAEFEVDVARQLAQTAAQWASLTLGWSRASTCVTASRSPCGH